jgi:hypothetical protein
MTLRELLHNMFGSSCEKIADFESINAFVELRKEVDWKSYVCIDSNSEMFVRCSGDVILGFSKSNNMQGCVYLINDNRDQESWKYRKAEGRNDDDLKRPCPSAKLRLVYSI